MDHPNLSLRSWSSRILCSLILLQEAASTHVAHTHATRAPTRCNTTLLLVATCCALAAAASRQPSHPRPMIPFASLAPAFLAISFTLPRSISCACHMAQHLHSAPCLRRSTTLRPNALIAFACPATLAHLTSAQDSDTDATRTATHLIFRTFSTKHTHAVKADAKVPWTRCITARPATLLSWPRTKAMVRHVFHAMLLSRCAKRLAAASICLRFDLPSAALPRHRHHLCHTSTLHIRCSARPIIPMSCHLCLAHIRHRNRLRSRHALSKRSQACESMDC